MIFGKKFVARQGILKGLVILKFMYHLHNLSKLAPDNLAKLKIFMYILDELKASTCSKRSASELDAIQLKSLQAGLRRYVVNTQKHKYPVRNDN